MIESFNVPHPEVERIAVNGIAVDFNYTVRDGDHIEVFPPGESCNGIPTLQLRADRPKMQPGRFCKDLRYIL